MTYIRRYPNPAPRREMAPRNPEARHAYIYSMTREAASAGRTGGKHARGGPRTPAEVAQTLRALEEDYETRVDYESAFSPGWDQASHMAGYFRGKHDAYARAARMVEDAR